MRGLATPFLAVCLAALAATTLSSADSTAVLDWPFGRFSQLPSPDGRHIVYGEPSQPGGGDAPELWLRNRGLPERKRLLQLTGTAKVFWSPDSRHFVVVDRENSSTMTSFVCDPTGRVVLQISPERSDKELRSVATGHFYVEAQRFLSANSIRVAAFGHTDERPVRCFRFVYSVTLGGKAKRVSMRISPATATACDETSE